MYGIENTIDVWNLEHCNYLRNKDDHDLSCVKHLKLDYNP